MTEDLYKVLGVSNSASDDDIRKAYRKLAKKLHPDLNPGNEASADEFKRVSAAYAILGDREQRAKYDAGEIDASGQERPEPRYYREHAGADGGEGEPPSVRGRLHAAQRRGGQRERRREWRGRRPG